MEAARAPPFRALPLSDAPCRSCLGTAGASSDPQAKQRGEMAAAHGDALVKLEPRARCGAAASRGSPSRVHRGWSQHPSIVRARYRRGRAADFAACLRDLIFYAGLQSGSPVGGVGRQAGGGALLGVEIRLSIEMAHHRRGNAVGEEKAAVVWRKLGGECSRL